MYIVRIEKEPHSAWTTKEEADKQAEVLRNYGYRTVDIRQDETVETENGHYYM